MTEFELYIYSQKIRLIMFHILFSAYQLGNIFSQGFSYKLIKHL